MNSTSPDFHEMMTEYFVNKPLNDYVETMSKAHMKKLISYIITVGGDTGWRFSNSLEWCSTPGMLLFDEECWTMESIADAVKTLYNEIRKDKHGFTYSEIYKIGIEHIKKFVNTNFGVYVNSAFEGLYDEYEKCKSGYMRFSEVKLEKQIDPSSYEVRPWEMDGCQENYDYYD